ncbi:trichohyalin-like [Sinocyclocheilus anshuiensis]|uniref:trichohyalin-like n=1 Tax=Sinocyclocheilus anshuiensis TaxID=1608454 RepID=UPI0007B81F12|nr:PREDICTED: trichohyalin-like [Sinocyclocheilus anshuiensis]
MAAWVGATTREMGQSLINPDKPSVSASALPGDTGKPALRPKPHLMPKPFALQRNSTVRPIRAPKTNFSRELHRAASSEALLDIKKAGAGGPNLSESQKSGSNGRVNGSNQIAAPKPVPLGPKPDLLAKPKPEPTKSPGSNNQTGPNSKPAVTAEDVKDVQPRSRAKSLGSQDQKILNQKDQGEAAKTEADVKVSSRCWPPRNRLSVELTSKFESPSQPEKEVRRDAETSKTEKEWPPHSPSESKPSKLPVDTGEMGDEDVSGGSIKRRISLLFDRSTAAQHKDTFDKRDNPASEISVDIKQRIQNLSLDVPRTRLPSTGGPKSPPSEKTPNERSSEKPAATEKVPVDKPPSIAEIKNSAASVENVEEEEDHEDEEEDYVLVPVYRRLGTSLDVETKRREEEEKQRKDEQLEKERQQRERERLLEEERKAREIERQKEEQRKRAEEERKQEEEKQRQMEEKRKQEEERKRRIEEEKERLREEERVKKEREMEEERRRIQELERQKDEERLRQEREKEERLKKQREMEERKRMEEEERLRQEQEMERIRKEKEMEEERQRIQEIERQKEEERLRKERELERLKKEKEMEEERQRIQRQKEEERLRKEREIERLRKEREIEERKRMEEERQREEERLRQERERERLNKEKEMEEERRRIQELERQKEEERLRNERELERLKKEKEMEEDRRRTQEIERQKEEERLRKERKLERMRKEKEMEEERRTQEIERQKEEERLRKERELERLEKEKEMEEERRRTQEIERLKKEERLRKERELERLKKEKEMEEERRRTQEIERLKEEEKRRQEREHEMEMETCEAAERVREEVPTSYDLISTDASQTLVSTVQPADVSPRLTQVTYDDFSVKPRRWGTRVRCSSSPSRETPAAPHHILQPESKSSHPGPQEPSGDQVSVHDLIEFEPEVSSPHNSTESRTHTCLFEAETESKPGDLLEPETDEGQLKDGEPEEHGVAEQDTENLIGETDEQTENNDTVDDPATQIRINQALRRLTQARRRNTSTDSDTADVPVQEEPEALPVLESAAPLLDSSVFRSKVDLGKKRSIKRSRPSRAVRQRAVLPALTEGTQSDWRFCDSTDAKDQCSNGVDSESDEEPSRDVTSSPAPNQPKRVPVFPGMDPSALMAQLKRRSAVIETESPTEAVPSRSPRTPTMALGPRVLPPVDAKDSGSGSSPSWLLELKSKKRMSQPESEA